MGRRRDLKGIAAGISGKFVSRYNDLDGYWALGVVYAALKEPQPTFELDVLSGESTPALAASRRLSTPFRLYLEDHLERRELEGCVAGAVVKVEFNIDVSGRRKLPNTWGEPFRCCVRLTDDLGVVRQFEVLGWCGRHNPKREHRSARR
ncbi:MAG: hypothetical protein R3E66_05460 [bacterium]